ncbi:glycoside hydrolase family 25 protein [Xylaria arbuscula]|nr:glycoside hydrolase family 25 protein [Xylaria arbuscula]
MKASLISLLGLANGALATVQGFDISHYQSSVNFAAAYSAGARFVIIKATEGTTYLDPSFSSHYTGATNAGFIRGGYHFAHLDTSSGATQANYFLAHGGGWSGDGITLPGMLDLEGSCVLSASATVSWIKDFSNTYHSKTGVYPLIYTNPSWWSSCTGNSNAFINTNPLVLARYSSSAGTPPGGWPYYTFWQYNDAYKYGGDSDVFNGDLAHLQKIASG